MTDDRRLITLDAVHALVPNITARIRTRSSRRARCPRPVDDLVAAGCFRAARAT